MAPLYSGVDQSRVLTRGVFGLCRVHSSLTATYNRPLAVSDNADLFLAYYNNTVNHQRSKYAPFLLRRYAIIIIINTTSPFGGNTNTRYCYTTPPHPPLSIVRNKLRRNPLRRQDISSVLPYLRSRSIACSTTFVSTAAFQSAAVPRFRHSSSPSSIKTPKQLWLFASIKQTGQPYWKLEQPTTIIYIYLSPPSWVNVWPDAPPPHVCLRC